MGKSGPEWLIFRVFFFFILWIAFKLIAAWFGLLYLAFEGMHWLGYFRDCRRRCRKTKLDD